ncbi:MAG: RNA pseudouridine synthase [Paludibacteraceae bacterium]|nr:RNA pseudouridine synthase [Paludibacteraceae bacterium]
MFHRFQQNIDGIELPKQFTYPFSYEPHPLSVMAADEVRAYISSQPQWSEELAQGKMFGVLVVRNGQGELGFLAAFSGQLAGTYQHDYFVPPVYDLSEPDGFFRDEERYISSLNDKVESIASSAEYLSLRSLVKELEERMERLAEEWRVRLAQAKEERDARRSTALTEAEEQQLVKESQFLKAECKREKSKLQAELSQAQAGLTRYDEEMEALKRERKQRSAALQGRLFDQFVLLNAKGENRSLCGIFSRVGHPIPPSGAGECAAPKLLQYAFLNHYEPLCMAEFWWGASPKAIVRHHGHFYPACKSKCEPILGFMLQGLDVEDSPIQPLSHELALEIVWEDDYVVVVNKPAGVLSVPGKSDTQSVYSFVRKRYPEATGPLVVHRLDMSTSGLMVVAKTKEVHQALQKQFNDHTIQKRYVALLQGELSTESGTICLPICPDVEHRPCQMVSERYGKYALTEYEVIGRKEGVTRVYFYPKTGRTHQLRLHAAHAQGLGMPIVGDELYGKKADRLYLQAQRIEFTHPVTGERITVEVACEF